MLNFIHQCLINTLSSHVGIEAEISMQHDVMECLNAQNLIFPYFYPVAVCHVAIQQNLCARLVATLRQMAAW